MVMRIESAIASHIPRSNHRTHTECYLSGGSASLSKSLNQQLA